MKHVDNIINELKKNKIVLGELLNNLDSRIYNWKPNPKKWCLLEIICHLYDEECEDFRARLTGILENPNNEFEPIDPVGWVSSRKYIEQNFNTKLHDFLEERDNSIKYIQNLQQPNWENYYQHTTLGNLTAKMFLTNWLAHDYLHIRQIIKIKYDYLKI